jgi:hypothetical protein
MKTIKRTLLLLSFAILGVSCSSNNEDKDGNTPGSTAFNPNDYTEYLMCKVGDFNFNTGNSAGNTTSIYAFKAGSTLHLTSSDSYFISGTTQPMQIKMQLKDFDAVNLKSYDVSSTYPSEVFSYKHVDGDSYNTSPAMTTTPQNGSITITKIENGLYSGTFSFIAYNIDNSATTLQVSEGKFRFKL